MKLESKGVMAFVWVVLLASGGLCGTLSTDYLKVKRNADIYDELTVVQGAAPTNGPELYYGFDQAASGNQVEDDSFNGNTGTLMGTNVVWSSEVPSGTSGGSCLFNNGGTEDSCIDVNYGVNLELKGPFTLAAWIKRTIADDTQAIFMKGATYSGCEYGLGENSGELGFMTGTGGFWTTNTPVSNGQWYHVAGVLEGSGANESKIYVNGQLVGQGTLSLPDSGATMPLYIGFWRPDPNYSYYFRGYIDEPSIFTRALSLTEVQQLYSNTLSYAFPTGAVFHVDDTEVTVKHLKKQGDLGMGTFTNEP